MDDILSLALESSGIASETEKEGIGGVFPGPSLEALFGVPSTDRSGPDLGSILTTATPNAPLTQELRLDNRHSSGQNTTAGELPPLDINPFASAHFGESKKLSIEDVLDAVMGDSPSVPIVAAPNEPADLAQLFAQPASSLTLNSSLSTELDMALDAALFGSPDLPASTSETHTTRHDMFLPPLTTSVPQTGRPTPAAAVSLPTAARHMAATPSPLVYSTLAPQQIPHPATSAPAGGLSQPGAMTGVMMASSRGTGPVPLARPPMVQRALSTSSRALEDDQLMKQVVLSATDQVDAAEQEVEVELEAEDDYGTGDTYATYKPAKVKIGITHPDQIVESSTLSSVEPPNVWLDLKLPADVISEGKLSALQLEAVIYACQQQMNILGNSARAGYLVGDGAGVGKGRIVAGIIFQNYLEGRKKALWLSVSNDLKFDAIRDLRDIGARNVTVSSLNKFRYGKISGKRNGRVKKGVIFATYSALIGKSMSGGKYSTRLNQLIHWLGSDFDGVIVLDECHKAKNLFPSKSGKPSKTGAAVVELQDRLPKARVVYCSATGASEPRNMGYMSRLGIWGKGTQFPGFMDFIKAVERRGVGAMEIVAMDMKLRGMYIARQLSFHGVTFLVKEVALSEDFIDMYDAAVELWVEAKRRFEEAEALIELEGSHMWSLFWAAHQRFFKYLCIAAKVKESIALAKKAQRDGKCVVIGLHSTGEARTLEQLERAGGELTEFVSTAKGVLESLIKKNFPTADMKKTAVATASGLDLTLFSDDPTLPASLRKRLRGNVSSSESEGDVSTESSSESSDTEESDSESSSSGDNDGIGAFKMFESSAHSSKKKKPVAKKRRTPKTKAKDVKRGGTPRRASLPPPPPDHPLSRFKAAASSAPLSPLAPTAHVASAPCSRSVSRCGSPSTAIAAGSSGSLKDSLATISRSATTGMVETAKGIADPAVKNSLALKLKEELLHKLDVLTPYLPHNTLDELVMGLGGAHAVAEMTGRRGRLVSQPDGTVKYQLRSQADAIPVEMLNLVEKEAFMNGDKEIAVISEAASSGISLQADRRVKNQKRRVHITLELPWSADKAIQQFGRTHRSNQTSAPEYIFLISALAGEKRFASTVAKRLESLGALTHGDRRAGDSRDLSKFNIDTKYGRAALEVVLHSITGIQKPLVVNKEYDEQFFTNIITALIGVGMVHRNELNGRVDLDKDATNLPKFLNRLLGVPVKLQNQLFNYFTDTLAVIIQQAKRLGKWDGGILDFGAGGESVEVVESEEFIGDPAFGTATTYLHKVLIERGVSFSAAMERLNQDTYPGEGFYLSKRTYHYDLNVAILVKLVSKENHLYVVTRPNTGIGQKQEKLVEIQAKYSKVSPKEAEKWWNMQYEQSLQQCQHTYTLGRCKLSLLSGGCSVGQRRRVHFILSGSVLGIWTHMEAVFGRHMAQSYKMQIVRVQTTEGKKLVGIEIPLSCVPDLHQTLTNLAKQVIGDDDVAMTTS